MENFFIRENINWLITSRIKIITPRIKIYPREHKLTVIHAQEEKKLFRFIDIWGHVKIVKNTDFIKISTLLTEQLHIGHFFGLYGFKLFPNLFIT